jgi:ADP-dependent NAD(P)H-hydrate dehydratase / NAD(P)H-hydrate epimerase
VNFFLEFSPFFMKNRNKSERKLLMRYCITPQQMSKLEKSAEERDITSHDLMEKAGAGIALKSISFVSHEKLSKKALIIAGKGNNGGDGYVVARHLIANGFSTLVWQVYPIKPDSLIHKEQKRFEAAGGKIVHGAISDYVKEGIVIDALFGTGFAGELDETAREAIVWANHSQLPIIAIDVPSGLNATTGSASSPTIQATVTIAIEYAKTGFFLKEGYNYIGALCTCPIGLEQFFDPKDASFALLEKQDVASLLPHVVRNQHKYSRGDVAALAGSHGMAGAALLACSSALKAGAGIVHLLHRDDLAAEFAGSPLEVVRVPYKEKETVINTLKKASSCIIGPGIGRDIETEALLEAIWPLCKSKKTVFDADALTWIAKDERKKVFGKLPMALFTPHIGEIERLFGQKYKSGVEPSLLAECQAFVEEHATHLVLKGGPTFLFAPNKLPLIVSIGDPGMATAGSGDVLTGILGALLACGLEPYDAMRLGVYLHGDAGRLAALEETSYSVTASSIIAHLPNAFKALLGEKIDLVHPWRLFH